MRRALLLIVLAGCGRIGFDEVCGASGPCVDVRINDGATYARAPRLTVKVTTSTDDAGQEAQFSEGPCELAADGVWHPHADGTPVPVLVEPVDGAKQVCVWVRDSTGVGFASATIQYETLNLPQIDVLDVVALDATTARATWTVSDVEGLAANPMDFEIRTGTDWMPLATEIGGGVGATTSATGAFDFAMPQGPFMVRATVRDRAGNRGVPAISDIIGAPNWHVYAGTDDNGIGESARALLLEFAENTAYMFAVDPQTMDAYVVDRETGVIRVDGATGDSTLLIGIGVNNLPDDGPLPVDAKVPLDPALHIGPDGKLYVSAGTSSVGSSSRIYQIDPQTLHCKRYIGGGMGNDATATPATVFVSKQVWTFDEDGALYFLTACVPNSTTAPFRMRFLRAARNADGSAGALTVLAGNCATPGGLIDGLDATTVPLPGFANFPGIGTISVLDQGRLIYVGSNGPVAFKILDGRIYSSDLPVGSEGTLALDAVTRTVLVGHGAVEEHMAGAPGTSDLQIRTRLKEDGGTRCADDNVNAVDACVEVGYGIQSTQARVYFADGTGINNHRAYRVRFIDRAGRLQTYVGGHGFYGEGLHRRSVRSRMGGIVYKPASASNGAAFPAGLYFTDPLDLVMARIDPATDRASVVWGNRSGAPRTYNPGETLGTDKGLGFNYGAGNLAAMTFDTAGLPMLRYGTDEDRAGLLTADAMRRAQPLMTGTQRWETMANGADPTTAGLWPYGALNNLTYYAGNLFVLGGYTNYNATSVLKRFDFVNGTTTRLMGLGADAFTPDGATPATASLSGSCHDGISKCFTQYNAADDRLYFSEDNRLRYLTTPLGPTQSLGTLFIAPTDVRNFTFRPDGSQIYYANGGLRCHDITSGSAACNDTVLGPPALLGTIGLGPDQLTWIDNNTLLISTHTGRILQYTVQ
ncbi:MAG TPA: hypothetical protein VMZ53_28495 [Kofleriaceae bacterium]|nr:hypothetical protein [Kofleriaceae bacterium]